MAEKTKKSYADRIREKQRQKAEDKVNSNSGNELEWIPPVGAHKIRVLPPINFTKDTFNSKGELVGKKGEEDDFFYMTHAYHFFEGIGPEGRGKMLWVPKFFEIDGKRVKDPVDEAVAQMYDIGRKNNDTDLKMIAGKIKRKRQFFANIIRMTEEGPEFKILKDASNEGKLMKEICKNMAFPFFKDVNDEWVVPESLEVDEDQTIYDLVDVNEGHDFKIKKIKTGHENWDIAYDSSLAVQKSRALTDEEKELLDERVDLRNFVKYATYEELVEAFEEYLNIVGLNDEFQLDTSNSKKTVTKKRPINEDVDDNDDEDFEDDDEDEEVAKPKKTKAPITKKKKRPVVEEDDDDFDEEDLLNELEDDEE